MTNDDELTPQNRRIICDRIGEETGIDGELLDQVLKGNTAEELGRFRDAFLKAKREEAVRQGYFTPRTPTDGKRPKTMTAPKTPSEQFGEWFTENF